MADNRDRLGKALALVETGAKPYVEAVLAKHYGARWRDHARLPNSLSPRADLDVHAVVYAIVNNWREVFQSHLRPEVRDAASAVFAGRNSWAHSTGEIEDNLTLRALLGAVDLLKAISAKSQLAIAEDLAIAQQDAMSAKRGDRASGGAPDAPAAVADAPVPAAPRRPTLTLTNPKAGGSDGARQAELGLGGGEVQGLTPWRIACPPRDDVLEGRLNKDSFAANLAAADRGEGSETYADALAFFNATHLTNGLELTLRNAIKRLTGGGGPSTIGLQTNFGGGKTHTLLALLQLTRLGSLKDVPTLAALQSDDANTDLRTVSTAVFVGTDKGPDQPLERARGKPIRTLWGYLAHRLAGDEGLALIEASEEAGTNPGAEVLQRLFALSGPSLILLDELVAYVRQLAGERYEAHLTFFQSLTEAAAQTKNVLIVGSLPESEIEAGGGEKGLDALRRLEKLFGRTQSAWQPAQGAETYAVVRRRLFQDLDENGEKARKRTVEAFRKLYRDHKGDFPAHTAERDYEQLLTEAYPVHPMLFDKLSVEWGGLAKFQRTRGVLSLLARTIFASYRDCSNEPLILPSSLRINDPEVRGALVEPLSGPAWGSIIDGEVDGDNSLPARIEVSRPRYRNHQVVRRAARAVFVCTAPKGDARGGLTGPELRLSCATPTPGEQISAFGDALRELAERAGFLYEAEGRYWFGEQPTLNKLADNRASDIDADAVDAEIVSILRADERAGRGRWSRLHVAPNPPTDVEDAPLTRLVVLGPDAPYVSGGGSPAETAALDAVARRAGGQRRFRNALVFLAADQRALEDARRAVRRALAWHGIENDRSLELTPSQADAAKARAAETRRGAAQAVRKAWSHLLSPMPSADDAAVVTLDRASVRTNGQGSIAEAAFRKAADDSAVLEQLGRASLVDRLESLWANDQADLEIDRLRDWFFEFPYMERLRDEQVLADAISAAVADINDGLGLAAGKTEAGGYVGLEVRKRVAPRFGAGQLLVRNAVALVETETPPHPDEPARSGEERPGGQPGAIEGGGETERSRPKRFVGVVQLDALRGLSKAGQVFESVVTELDRVPGARFRITLEIQADAEAGFPEDIEGVVNDNAATLGFVERRFD